MQVVVLLVCFLLSICATVTSLMAWKGMHEVSGTPLAVVGPSAAAPPARPNTQQLDALSSQVATLSAEVTALKDTVANQATAAAAASTTTTTPAAPPVALDDAKIKELIRAEMLNQFRMMRGGGGGFNQADPTAIARQLQEQLTLDPAKATQVAALVVTERAAVRAIYQNANGATREELAPKVKDERDKLDVETAKILSADEQTKLGTWLDRQQMRRQRPDPNAAAPAGSTPGATPPAGGATAGAPTTPPAGPSSF